MDAIFQFLFDRSKLDVTHVQITDPTTDAYTIQISNHVSGTGPVSSTVTAMEVDIRFNGVSFSKLLLPEFRTQASGVELDVPTQTVHITNMDTFMGYVGAIITSEEVKFELANGVCKVKALGLHAKCNFRREFSIPGMGGPSGQVLDLQREDAVVTLTVRCLNASPVEIDQGIVNYELRNENQECVAQLKGHVKLVRGEFDVVLRGKTKPGAKVSASASLQGVGAEEDTWSAQAAKFVVVKLDMKPEFTKILEEAVASSVVAAG